MPGRGVLVRSPHARCSGACCAGEQTKPEHGARDGDLNRHLRHQQRGEQLPGAMDHSVLHAGGTRRQELLAQQPHLQGGHSSWHSCLAAAAGAGVILFQDHAATVTVLQCAGLDMWYMPHLIATATVATTAASACVPGPLLSVRHSLCGCAHYLWRRHSQTCIVGGSSSQHTHTLLSTSWMPPAYTLHGLRRQSSAPPPHANPPDPGCGPHF
jgi:hypothetical protein